MRANSANSGLGLDVRLGQSEKLPLSICCPLSRRKRTSLGRFATSALCQKRRSIRILIQCGAHSFCRPQASWCRSTRGDRNLYRLNGIPQRIGSRTRGQLSATQQNRLQLTLNETLSTSDCVPSKYQKINDISAISAHTKCITVSCSHLRRDDLL